MSLNEEQFYKLWERFAVSEIESVEGFCVNDVEEFCAQHEITVDYFIEEFI